MDDTRFVWELVGVNKIPAMVGKDTFVTITALDMFKTDGCLVGVEIELEYAEERDFAYWTCTNDGSLRNSGVEYVSMPFSHKYSDVVMEDFNKNINKGARATGRCGLHVHVNVLDMTVGQLRKFAKLVYQAEDNLYNTSGNRVQNYHCTPWKGSVNEAAFLRFAEGKLDVNRFLDGHCHKYSGVNFRPVSQHGTVEFRMHEGTRDTKRIIQWINTLVNLKTIAVS